MNWISWVIVVVVVVVSGVATYLWRRGYIKETAVIKCVETVYNLCVDAEILWMGVKKAGALKKSYVLEQLHKMGVKYNDTVLGSLIDAVVGLLNAMEWKKEE